MSLLLGNPIGVINIGKVYPIKVKDYAVFSYYSWALQKSRKSLNVEDSEESLFSILIKDNFENETDERKKGHFLEAILCILSLVTRQEVEFIRETFSFKIGSSTFENIDGKEAEFESERFLNESNFEEFREIVCKQNAVIEDRYYKNQFYREMIEDEKKRRSNKKGAITIDTMISVVSVEMCVGYDFINEMTYMQFASNFNRIILKQLHEDSIKYASSGNFKDVKIQNYYEEIDLFKHPDDEIVMIGNNPLGGLRL